MFEFGWDQAAGLRAGSPCGGPTLMPVASTAQPARAYELLCTLASQIDALGGPAVIIDGTATEVLDRRSNDGSHLGLLHALQDASVSGLARPATGAEWLVMPGALGMQALQQTARAAGGAVALSRLLAPFAPGAMVLLYAPALRLAELLSGLQARTLVPVLSQPQSSIDAYGSLKLLHGAGLLPVLAPLDLGLTSPRLPLQQVVQAVADCAGRHLGFAVDTWPMHSWALRMRESALRQPVYQMPQDVQRGLREAAPGARQMAAHTPWS